MKLEDRRAVSYISATMLSESSNGSNPLQPALVTRSKPNVKFTFRILKRIESPATSSNMRDAFLPMTFQNPQTDRIPCNPTVGYALQLLFRLSESSNGSNPLQHVMKQTAQAIKSTFQNPQTDRIPCNHTDLKSSAIELGTFRILKRIESPATI